ncbi:Hypothetical protein A7982_07915 [Minicystis rosea]|nr:Hypothetical protein A7982_07915 [Minicystis rosea]
MTMPFEIYAQIHKPAKQDVESWMEVFTEWAKARVLIMTASFADAVKRALVADLHAVKPNPVARLAPLAKSLEKIGPPPVLIEAGYKYGLGDLGPTEEHRREYKELEPFLGMIEFLAFDTATGILTIWYRSRAKQEKEDLQTFLDYGAKYGIKVLPDEIASVAAKQVTHEQVHHRASGEMQRQGKKVYTDKDAHTHIGMGSVGNAGSYLMTLVGTKLLKAKDMKTNDSDFIENVLKLRTEWEKQNGYVKNSVANMAPDVKK